MTSLITASDNTSTFMQVYRLVFLFCVMVFSNNSSAEAGSTQVLDTISVVGYGKIQVVPDEVYFSVGLYAKSPTVQPAYQEVEEQMKKTLLVLKRLNIAEKNIQAMAVNISPVIDYKSRDRNIIAHEVKRDVSIKVTDIATYAKAIHELAKIGVTRFQQVQMQVSDEEAQKLEALEKAYANAETKAKRLAEKSGRSIEKLIVLVEQGASFNPPILKHQVRTMSAASDMLESSGSASVSAGLITLSAGVQATFKLK